MTIKGQEAALSSIYYHRYRKKKELNFSLKNEKDLEIL